MQRKLSSQLQPLFSLLLATTLVACSQSSTGNHPESVSPQELSTAIPSVPGVVVVTSYFISGSGSSTSLIAASFSGEFYVLSLTGHDTCTFAQSDSAIDTDPQHRLIRLDEGMALTPEAVPTVTCDGQKTTVLLTEGLQRYPSQEIDLAAEVDTTSVSLSVANPALVNGTSLLLDRKAVVSYGMSIEDTYIVPTTVNFRALAFFQERVDDATGIVYGIVNAVSLQVISQGGNVDPL